MKNSDQEIQADIVSVARSILAGEVDQISGSRKIVDLAARLPFRDPEIFDAFVAFESETDAYPVGEARQHYHKSYLDELDQQMAAYSQQFRPHLLQACERIIEEYDLRQETDAST